MRDEPRNRSRFQNVGVVEDADEDARLAQVARATRPAVLLQVKSAGFAIRSGSLTGLEGAFELTGSPVGSIFESRLCVIVKISCTYLGLRV